VEELIGKAQISFLCTGNLVQVSKNSETGAADCAPCTDSNLNLKEQILMPDKIKLVDANDSKTPPTDDEELLA
jgi:hypothetical protein